MLGLVTCFSYCWICRDSLWVQIAFGFIGSRSDGLAFSLGFMQSRGVFTHGSDNGFSSRCSDGFSKDAFNRPSDYVTDISKFPTYACFPHVRKSTRHRDRNLSSKWSILSLELVSMPHSCPRMPDHHFPNRVLTSRPNLTKFVTFITVTRNRKAD